MQISTLHQIIQPSGVSPEKPDTDRNRPTKCNRNPKPSEKVPAQTQKKETRNRDRTSVIHSFLTNLKLLT